MEEKKKKIRLTYLLLAITLWVCVIFWMMVIFLFSSESGSDSATRSEEFGKLIVSLTGREFPLYLVRKFAHFAEFAILTLLSYFALASSSKILLSRRILVVTDKDIKPGFDMNASFSIWITVLFAVIDEYHQLFVPGRNGSVFDVLIDVAGGMLVLIFIRIVIFITNIIRKKRPEEPLLVE